MDAAERKTNLTRNLDAITKDNKTRYDAMAKQILGDKEILARIMKGAVSEFCDMEIPDIIRCIEGTPNIGSMPVFPRKRFGD